jgi:hypothetical protein
MDLGKLGVWAGLDGLSAAEALAFAQRLEKRGYKAFWTPESRGRNVLVNAAWLPRHLASVIATGIANIYARDAVAMANAQRSQRAVGQSVPPGAGVSTSRW